MKLFVAFVLLFAVAFALDEPEQEIVEPRELSMGFLTGLITKCIESNPLAWEDVEVLAPFLEKLPESTATKSVVGQLAVVFSDFAESLVKCNMDVAAEQVASIAISVQKGRLAKTKIMVNRKDIYDDLVDIHNAWKEGSAYETGKSLGYLARKLMEDH